MATQHNKIPLYPVLETEQPAAPVATAAYRAGYQAGYTAATGYTAAPSYTAPVSYTPAVYSQSSASIQEKKVPIATTSPAAPVGSIQTTKGDAAPLLGGDKKRRRRCGFCSCVGCCVGCTCKCICIIVGIFCCFSVIVGIIAGVIFGVQHTRCVSEAKTRTDMYSVSASELTQLAVTIGATLPFLSSGSVSFHVSAVPTSNVTVTTTLSAADQNILNAMTVSRSVQGNTLTYNAQASSTYKPVWWTTFWNCPTVSAVWELPSSAAGLGITVSAQNLPINVNAGGLTLGAVSLTTTDSSITATNIVSTSLVAQSTNGDVTLNNVAALNAVAVKTTNSDVNLAVVGASTLTISTTNGAVSLGGVIVNSATIASTNGKIVTQPTLRSDGTATGGLFLNKTGAACSLSMETTNGRIETTSLAIGVGPQKCTVSLQTTNGAVDTSIYQGGLNYNCAFDGTYTVSATNSPATVSCASADALRPCQGGSKQGGTLTGSIGISNGPDSLTASTTNGHNTLTVLAGCPSPLAR